MTTVITVFKKKVRNPCVYIQLCNYFKKSVLYGEYKIWTKITSFNREAIKAWADLHTRHLVKTGHSASSATNKENKKQKEDNTYICSICMDVIKEADNTNDGHDATFVKVLVTHGYTICVQAYPNLFLTSEAPFCCPHCHLQR